MLKLTTQSCSIFYRMNQCVFPIRSTYCTSLHVAVRVYTFTCEVSIGMVFLDALLSGPFPGPVLEARAMTTRAAPDLYDTKVYFLCARCEYDVTFCKFIHA